MSAFHPYRTLGLSRMCQIARRITCVPELAAVGPQEVAKKLAIGSVCLPQLNHLNAYSREFG